MAKKRGKRTALGMAGGEVKYAKRVGENRDRLVTVRVTRGELARLHARAAADGSTLTMWVRRALARAADA